VQRELDYVAFAGVAVWSWALIKGLLIGPIPPVRILLMMLALTAAVFWLMYRVWRLRKLETNETYTIEVGSPLLRPGMKIGTQVSARYLVPVTTRLMDKVREINTIAQEQQDAREVPEDRDAVG
jgi:hypothetical protein